MVLAAALTVFAARSGVIAIDAMAIGMCTNGKWRTTDGGIKDAAGKHSKATAYRLSLPAMIETERSTLKYSNDEGEPETLHAWYIEPFPDVRREAAVWFGPKPAAPKVKRTTAKSGVYFEAVRTYMKAKGVKNPQPAVVDVLLADLDANGTQEAVIFTTSRIPEEMWGTLSLTGEEKHPSDFAAVLVRYVSGKTVKTVEACYTDGVKQGLDGFWQNRGVWDLDGVPGLELLIASNYYESHGGMVLRFKSGKIIKLAEHVVGV